MVRKEGVLPGYNPRRHGRPTHHPLPGGLAEAKWILHGWLRAGNVATANNARAFMDECPALLDGLATLRLARAGNGFFDGKFLDFLEEKGLPYMVKARMTKWVKFAVLGVPDWSRVGKGIEVSYARVKLLGWTRERRLIVIRQEVATKETEALGKKRFECQGYTFQGIVTSKAIEEMDATAVYRTYNGRADFENRIKELKSGCVPPPPRRGTAKGTCRKPSAATCPPARPSSGGQGGTRCSASAPAMPGCPASTQSWRGFWLPSPTAKRPRSKAR